VAKNSVHVVGISSNLTIRMSRTTEALPTSATSCPIASLSPGCRRSIWIVSIDIRAPPITLTKLCRMHRGIHRWRIRWLRFCRIACWGTSWNKRWFSCRLISELIAFGASTAFPKCIFSGSSATGIIPRVSSSRAPSFTFSRCRIHCWMSRRIVCRVYSRRI